MNQNRPDLVSWCEGSEEEEDDEPEEWLLVEVVAEAEDGDGESAEEKLTGSRW